MSRCGRSVMRRSSWACSIRSRRKYWCGDKPKCCRKTTPNREGERLARRAMSATDRGSPTWKERYDETQFSECDWREVTAVACPYCLKIDSSNVMAKWF